MLIGAATLIVSNPTFAGDYLTNTNQNAAFLRMVARGASIDVDGVYSNPAGLAFLPKDGFHLSLTGQSAYQTREIHASTPLWTQDGNITEKYYKGTASAPLIPSFHGAYKRDNWVISAGFAITGGGGKASFDNGLPMFDAMAAGLIAQQSQGLVTPSMYDINTAMDGKQYIYGVQLGLSYKINDWLSVFAGGRMNYVKSEKDLVDIYNSVDIYVTPSLQDNLPNTIVEAMSCGIPCVGFQTGGIPQMIDHLHNGYVAEYKSASDLANGIKWVLTDGDYQTLSEEAHRKAINTYSETTVAHQYLQIYNKLTGKNA